MKLLALKWIIEEGGIMLNGRMATQIRLMRKKQKMTQEELADKSEIDMTYFGRIERNEVNITLKTLDKIIRGLNLSYEEFFDFIEVNNGFEPELVALMFRVNESSKRDKIIKIIDNILDVSE